MYHPTDINIDDEPVQPIVAIAEYNGGWTTLSTGATTNTYPIVWNYNMSYTVDNTIVYGINDTAITYTLAA